MLINSWDEAEVLLWIICAFIYFGDWFSLSLSASDFLSPDSIYSINVKDTRLLQIM